MNHLICSSAIHDAIRADATAWALCTKLGVQRWPAFDGEPAGAMEIRLCPRCSSSIGLPVAPALVITWDHTGDGDEVYWLGCGWTTERNAAIEYVTREDADLELRVARDTVADHVRGNVDVQEAA